MTVKKSGAPAQTGARLYLAGPLGFSEAGRYFVDDVLVPDLVRRGYQVVDPFKLTDPDRIRAITGMATAEARRLAWCELNREIGQTNQSALDNCDGVVAILDGTDVDSGTAAEIGYAFARGKPILGYRGDFRLSSDNEGATINLQVEYFIRASGGDIVSSALLIGETLAGMLASHRKRSDTELA
jgi:nucleoside 2-deoxyribosyltransferase